MKTAQDYQIARRNNLLHTAGLYYSTYGHPEFVCDENIKGAREILDALAQSVVEGERYEPNKTYPIKGNGKVKLTPRLFWGYRPGVPRQEDELSLSEDALPPVPGNPVRVLQIAKA